MKGIILHGITWGHSRGITPLQAASQRYNELYPDVEIRWRKRSLQEFADFPIEKLAMEYDLLIIDHPWVGCAASGNSVLPLNEYLSEEFLDGQLSNSTGCSHLSYAYDNKQWALAIDAATPAASYRKDLLEKNGIKLPMVWSEVLELARAGKCAVPAIPIDLLMNFYSFCIAHGKEPFRDQHEIIDRETGIQSIETMKELNSYIDKRMFGYNPIAVAELMSQSDDYWYCPFAYCYSNYSRTGYGKHLIHYSDVVSFGDNRLRTTIGGTGLAVSTHSKYKAVAIDFTAWIASELIQRTLYVQDGGQPGHRSAWMDEDANHLTHGFFINVLPAIENAYMRPRYNGYLDFQDRAGLPLQRCLMEDGDALQALTEMNSIYQQSLVHKTQIAAV